MHSNNAFQAKINRSLKFNIFSCKLEIVKNYFFNIINLLSILLLNNFYFSYILQRTLLSQNYDQSSKMTFLMSRSKKQEI